MNDLTSTRSASTSSYLFHAIHHTTKDNHKNILKNFKRNRYKFKFKFKIETIYFMILGLTKNPGHDSFFSVPYLKKKEKERKRENARTSKDWGMTEIICPQLLQTNHKSPICF